MEGLGDIWLVELPSLIECQPEASWQTQANVFDTIALDVRLLESTIISLLNKYCLLRTWPLEEEPFP